MHPFLKFEMEHQTHHFEIQERGEFQLLIRSNERGRRGGKGGREEKARKEKEKEKGKGKRGRERERLEQTNCDITSIYQFFTIENDLDRGYDYRCVLCSARGLMGDGCIVAQCVGPTNLVNHMKRVHHFVSTAGSGTAEEKRVFLGVSAIPKEKVVSLAVPLLLSCISDRSHHCCFG